MLLGCQMFRETLLQNNFQVQKIIFCRKFAGLGRKSTGTMKLKETFFNMDVMRQSGTGMCVCGKALH